MLSAKGLGLAGAGAGHYYTSLAQEDYYTQGGEPPGRWYGQTAQQLGLTGTVDTADFNPLFHGFDRTGATPLVQDAGDEHYAGWDLTFSAPKSVSVLWAMTEDPGVRERIQAAQHAAVEATLGFAERHCAYTRRGHNGAEREKVTGLAVATFEHSVSREQDPQLHTHCLVANVAQRVDGTYGSVDGRDLFRWKMALGAIYRAELAAQLEARLPIQVVRDRQSFAIAGVPPTVQQHFSKRSEQIKGWLDAHGYEGAVAAQAGTLDTRQTKGDIDRGALLARWKQEGLEIGWGPAQAQQVLADPLTREQRAPPRLEDLQETLVSQQSTFDERAAWRVMAESMQGIGGLPAIETRMDAFWQEPGLIHVGKNRLGEERWSTQSLVQLESATLHMADTATQQRQHSLSTAAVAAVVNSRPTLTDEQATAVRYVCEHSGSVATVEGLPGTGKSFMLDTAREAWTAAGYHVIGAALSGKAALGLQDSAGIPSATLHARLTEWRQPGALTAKTVVVIDEAGMVGSRQMADVMQTTQAAGAKLVLVGDHRQLQPIEAGGIFRAMAARIDTAQLTDIRRQQQPWAKEAVQAIASGAVREAIDAYERRGMLHVGETKQATVHALVEQWIAAGEKNPQGSRLVIASERADVRDINRQIRSHLQRIGQLGAGQKATTEQGVKEFAVGDRVVMLRNSTPYGVRNGQLGTLDAISGPARKMTLRIRLDDGGRIVSLPLHQYGHIDHGYAVTTHKAQGATVDHTFVLAGGKMANREIALVQFSRHRQEAHAFVDRGFYRDAALDHAPPARHRARPDEIRADAADGQTLADRTQAADYSERIHEALAPLVRQLQVSQQKDVTLDYAARPLDEQAEHQ